jgi:cell division protein FtsW (lipid II flippase)
MSISTLWSRPTPRRRSELGLLIVGAVVVVVASFLVSLAASSHLPRRGVIFVIAVLIAGFVLQVVNRALVPDADPVLMPVALVLNGIGYVMIERLDPQQAGQQLAWTAVGLVVYALVLALIRRSRDLERYRYLMLIAAFVLLVLPVMPKLRSSPDNLYGAKLWVALGPLSFQPVEIAKLLLVVFFASYFVEKRELLTISTRRLGNFLLPDLRAFGPILVAGAMSVIIILAERDIGFSLLLFVVFLSMLWVTTGRLSYLFIGIAVFALGTFLASHVLSQVDTRISVWLNPWSQASGNGYQPIQGELAFGRGNLFGSGLGLGLVGDPHVLPVSTSDFIFAAIGEELGLVGTVALLVAYMLIIGSGIRAALRAPSEFAKLVALGLTAMIGFQTFFIIAGILRLLPLTGVTLPFVSYGGSSLVANYALLALVMRISNEGNQPDAPPLIS